MLIFNVYFIHTIGGWPYEKMKKNIPHLSPTEYAFMKILWTSQNPLTVGEILERREDGSWAKNSVHPLLNSLIEKGFISITGIMKISKANSRLYAAKISLAEYSSSQITKVFEKDKWRFNLSYFLSNFVESDGEIDETIVKELEDWLQQYKNDRDKKI